MAIEQIMFGAVTIIIGMLGFFLIGFYKQVQRIADDMNNMRVLQATNAEKLISIEKRVDFFDKYISHSLKSKNDVA